MAAKLKVDQLESVDGSTNLILNNSITMASGKTLPAASLTGNLPAISAASLTAIPAGNLTGTVADARISALTASKLTGALPAISGASVTSLNATNLGSGTIPTARLGSGTASSSTFLRGDSTYATAGGGKVLQVLQVENGTRSSTTSGTYQNTSILVSITPSATTSKILVFATIYTSCFRTDTQKYGATTRLIETVTSDVYPTGTDGNFGNLITTFPSSTAGLLGGVISGNWLHSPSSTSELTYKVQFKSWSGTNSTYINSPDDSANWGALKSTITVMEIGA